MNCQGPCADKESKRHWKERAPKLTETGSMGTQRTALRGFRSLGLSGDWISFRSSLASHSDSGSFLVVHMLSQVDQQEGFWEVVDVYLLLTFPNYSGWWWLVSSMILTRTFCHIVAQ